MKPTMLCYNLTGERGRKIRFAAMGLGIKLRNVDAEEYRQPLGALCGLAEVGEGIAPEGSFTDEMLLMAGFPDGLVSMFLQAFRKLKIPSVQLKAILTDTNVNWNSIQLHQELTAERDAVLRGGSVDHGEDQPQ